MIKFAVHYVDPNGLNRVWVCECLDAEHARLSFKNAKLGVLTKVKVVRGEHVPSAKP